MSTADDEDQQNSEDFAKPEVSNARQNAEYIAKGVADGLGSIGSGVAQGLGELGIGIVDGVITGVTGGLLGSRSDD